MFPTISSEDATRGDPQTAPPLLWKGPHRAEAEAHRVKDDAAVNAQRVDPLWADPVGIQQGVLSIDSHLDKRKTAPPPIKHLINEFH